MADDANALQCVTTHSHPHTKQTTRFQLTTPSRTFYLFCDTPEASMGWVTKIKQLVAQVKETMAR